MKTLNLNNSGKIAIVDYEDFDALSKFKWCFKVKRDHKDDGYAFRYIKGNKRVFMHRQIMGTKPGLEIDHINHNGLDNRKSNLRFCTHAENALNMRPRANSKSGVTGIMWENRLNKWRARIQLAGKKIHIGVFSTLEEAIIAYNDFKSLNGLLCNRT